MSKAQCHWTGHHCRICIAHPLALDAPRRLERDSHRVTLDKDPHDPEEARAIERNETRFEDDAQSGEEVVDEKRWARTLWSGPSHSWAR